jgi:hypothetical protein
MARGGDRGGDRGRCWGEECFACGGEALRSLRRVRWMWALEWAAERLESLKTGEGGSSYARTAWWRSVRVEDAVLGCAYHVGLVTRLTRLARSYRC